MTMKTLPKTLALGAAAGCLLLGGVAQAQSVPEPSSGEAPETGGTVACFYECKDGYQDDWWQEVTTLMLMNPGDPISVDDGTILNILDGNQNFLARVEINTPS
jgi:hypothetical protein